MNFLFSPAAQPSLSIADSDQHFPVRRIFCIGRNYADHVHEMGGTVDRGHPIFFMKPVDALVVEGGDIPYPGATSNFHHEVEMVVALASGGRDIAERDAGKLIFGYAVGLDLTRRDLQAAAKKAGNPWDAAKGVDHGAPISLLHPATAVALGPDTELTLTVNGETRQQSTLSGMIWPVPAIIAELSKLFELRAGDLLFTGTPGGVGPLVRGDSFRATLGVFATLEGRVV